MFLLQGLLISLVDLKWAKKGLEKEVIGKEMNLIQTVGSVLNAEDVNVIKKTIVLFVVHTWEKMDNKANTT